MIGCKCQGNYGKVIYMDYFGNDGYQFGDLLGSLKYHTSGTALQNDFNATEAEKQRQYETEMSNTAYQRAVNDMEAAGLNVGALGSSLSPASVPSGATASSASGVSSDGANVLGSILRFAAAVALLAKGVPTSANSLKKLYYYGQGLKK